MAKVSLSHDEFAKIMKSFPDIINPRRYYVVTDGAETFVFVPIKSSRHLHYYEVKALGESYSKLKQELENKGFTVVVGDVTFLPG